MAALARFFTILFCFLTCAPALAGEVALSGDTQSPPVTLTVGDELAVRLAGNPTTGYTWQARSVPPFLTLSGEPDYLPDAEGADRAGGGGVFVFRLIAQSPGKGVLRFVYLRPWEKDSPPESGVSCEVEVLE